MGHWAQSALCQNRIKFLGFLWSIKCGEILRWTPTGSICPSCGWIRPKLPLIPNPVKIPHC